MIFHVKCLQFAYKAHIFNMKMHGHRTHINNIFPIFLVVVALR